MYCWYVPAISMVVRSSIWPSCSEGTVPSACYEVTKAMKGGKEVLKGGLDGLLNVEFVDP